MKRAHILEVRAKPVSWEWAASVAVGGLVRLVSRTGLCPYRLITL
jgi:hypothetical protein